MWEQIMAHIESQSTSCGIIITTKTYNAHSYITHFGGNTSNDNIGNTTATCWRTNSWVNCWSSSGHASRALPFSCSLCWRRCPPNRSSRGWRCCRCWRRWRLGVSPELRRERRVVVKEGILALEMMEDICTDKHARKHTHTQSRKHIHTDKSEYQIHKLAHSQMLGQLTLLSTLL